MNEDARARALRLLDKRDYSRKLLLDKLTEKGVSPRDAAEVLDWLCDTGLVDDRRYAGLVVRHYAAKGYGQRRLRDELYRRGIDRALWDEALGELETADERLYTLLCQRLRGSEPSPDELRRAESFLLRRGYSWEEIRAALERYQAEKDME